MVTRRMALLLGSAALACLLFGCSREPVPESTEPTRPEMGWLDRTEENAAFVPGHSAQWDEENGTVSIFCWDSYFLNDAAFSRLAEPLCRLGVNRVYQELLPQQLSAPETAVMVENFAREGIETVCTAGDPDWLWDGPEPLYELMDALAAYNQGIGSRTPIRAVAIDAESYTRSGWKRNPQAAFADFTAMMAEAKQYANRQGLRVIQVIPTFLDERNPEQFREFVRSCCDEVSLMNYDKTASVSAIWNEVAVCRELGIPVETLFETMRLSERYSVLEENTFFYDGVEAMEQAARELREFYGTSLGIGYHHYVTLHNMICRTALVQLYPYTNSKDPDRTPMGQPRAPGVLWLEGSDGSRLPGYVYWPNGEGESCEYCYLITDAVPGVVYTVEIAQTVYTCAEDWTLERPDALQTVDSLHLLRSAQ